MVDDPDDFHEPYQKKMKRKHDGYIEVSDPAKKARGRPRKNEVVFPHDESLIIGTLLNDDDLVEDQP